MITFYNDKDLIAFIDFIHEKKIRRFKKAWISESFESSKDYSDSELIEWFKKRKEIKL